jgi:molecular chaperone GrpE
MSDQAGNNEEILNGKEADEAKAKPAPAGHHGEHREASEIKHLKEEIECLKNDSAKLKEENAALDDSYRRKVAEFDNYRKRMVKQMEDTSVEAAKKFLSEILPIFDNFGRALKSTEKSKDFEQLYNGLNVTNNGILHFFDHLGVKPMESIGKEFDPNFHEAVIMEERDDVPFEKTVVDELEKGYVLGDSVIRHSKVKVARKKQKLT